MNITNETIARYLRNELSPKELSDFTFKMVMNPDLRAEVEAMRTVFKTLKTTDLPNVAAGKSGGNQILYLVIGVLLVGVMAFFFFNNNQKEITPPVEKTTQKIDRPIAAAFETNEYFEQFVNAGHRGNDEIKLAAPQNKTSFNIKNEKVDLTFSGTTKIEADKILLTIWSNKMEDFENEKFVFQEEISVENEGFDFNTELNLSEGLYYFTLNEDKYFGAFLVEK